MLAWLITGQNVRTAGRVLALEAGKFYAYRAVASLEGGETFSRLPKRLRQSFETWPVGRERWWEKGKPSRGLLTVNWGLYKRRRKRQQWGNKSGEVWWVETIHHYAQLVIYIASSKSDLSWCLKVQGFRMILLLGWVKPESSFKKLSVYYIVMIELWAEDHKNNCWYIMHCSTSIDSCMQLCDTLGMWMLCVKLFASYLLLHTSWE